ncbi:MAG: hypothetical protein M3421_15805 [Bacteroidota bacterium]|jgi:hypothetical protein|nr:hypothetical protein [Bacteroidota bacterium]
MTEKFSPELVAFLTTWGQLGAFIFIGAGSLIFVYHMVRVMLAGEPKDKYDYIIRHEIKYLWYSSLMLIIGAVLYFNTYVVEVEMVRFVIKVLAASMIATLIGVVVVNMLKFYYPFYMEKRLKKLRYTPRISPKNGKAMKLLSEEDEDVYLNEGMQAEEHIFSVDYDVWLDEETQYIKIEKYAGHLHALKCPECKYQTLKVTKEAIIEGPTETSGGELMKYYKCSFCNNKEKRSFKIAKLPEKNIVSKDEKISLV